MACRDVIDSRVDEVMAALAIGKNRNTTALVRKLSDKWGVSTRQVERYLRVARARLRRSWDEQGPDMAALVFEAYTDLYRHSMENTKEPHQIQNARAILDRMTALAGLTGT
jgi:hypothetical protein